jgi:hypothetical protein
VKHAVEVAQTNLSGAANTALKGTGAASKNTKKK